MFRGSGVEITTSGDRHLGGNWITRHYTYVNKKVYGWIKDLRAMVEIAKDEPQACIQASPEGFVIDWNYIQRTVLDISHYFEPLERTM